MYKKIIFLLLFFYLFSGFFLIPFFLKPQIIEIVHNKTNAKITLDDVSFNPLTCKLELSKLTLYSQDDKELVYLKSIVLNVELYSLFKSAIHVSEFVLEEPRISLILDKNKQINLTSILKPSKEVPTEESSEPTQIPRIILDRIAILKGKVNYEDYSNKSKFEFELKNIGFELKDIDTQGLESKDAYLRFYTKLEDGGFVDINSEILSIEPFIVKGNIDYEASKLYTQWRYVQDILNLEVADGKLSLHTEYYFNLEDLPATTLSNLNIHLDNLRVKPKGDAKDVLRLKSLYVDNVTLKPLAQNARIDKIALNSLDIKAKRSKDGNIDWLDFIKMDSGAVETDKASPSESSESKPWDVLIDDISLENIQVKFEDSGIKPNVNTSLDELNIYAQNVTAEGNKPFDYQMDMRMNEKFKCTSKGSISHKVLDVSSSVVCKDLDVAYYVPYIDDIASKELEVYDVKLRSLIAGFDANITAKDINSSIVLDVEGANVHLNKFALNKNSTYKRLMTFSALDIKGINLNTATKEVFVKDTTMKYLNMRTKRLQDGSLSIENLVVPKVKPLAKKKGFKKKALKEEKEYRVRLDKVSLKAAKVTFEDQGLSPSVTSKIDRIYLTARKIDSKKYSWMNYYLSARVNESGKLKANGSLRHTPLKQKGKLELSKLSLKELTPYIQEHAYISLEEGYLNLNTRTNYAVSKDKPDLNVQGSFSVEEFFVNDSRDKSSLLSFSQLNLKEFTLETSPNRFYVKEVDINSFYVNARVDSNKTMNFSKLAKSTSDVNSTSTDESNTSTKEDSNTTAPPTFPVKIVKINVKDGSAIFSDASLPIHFETNIHDLNGEIYSVSNVANETSYIDIIGEIDEYGSTKLKGSLNASNPKSFTDLAFNFRNLDLSAMSGYSSSFAGYKIEDGKLFLNLNYDIKESELIGENSIIIKKIKLGEEVDIEGGSLPLGFVIGLLEDSDGIIDIDMPIRGNVDEPDFKYGALVWKTFGNLILKAVTSPFKFLGSMLGIGGDELEYAVFEGGSSSLLPSEREKMDNIAKLLIKRPKMNLSIGGGYNLAIDKKAMQREKLIAQVVSLSGAKNEKEKVTAMTSDLLEDIYEKVKDDNKLERIEDELEKKHKDKDEFKQAYLGALIKECSDIQIITPLEIQQLARKRSQVLTEYLVDAKGIEKVRVKAVEIIESEGDEKKLIKSKLEVIVK